MKSGEVAVENSVNAFPNLKSTKLKNHITMSPYGSPAHQHKQAQLPRLAQYQPHLLVPVQMPYQPQQFAMLQTYPVAQPLSPYHRYAAAMNYARSRTATGYQLLHMYPQPPPLPPQPHSAMKRNTKPIQPPISMPTQLQSPPDMDHLRARTKRSVCLRFARGMCQFGSTCKFSHDYTIKISDMPQSAPVSISERVQPQVSPMPCDQLRDNQDDVPSSLHDSNFPSLSPETGVSDKSSNLSGDPGDDNQLHSPPSKKLVFRDAVLQQTRKSADVNPLNWSSPLKTSSSCDEEPSAKPDDRVDDSNDQTPAHNKEDQNQPQKGQASVVQAERVNDPLRRSRDQSRSPDRKPGRRGYQLHQKPQLPEAFLRLQQQHLQVVLPPSGQPGYAVQPVYLVNQGGSDTRSTLSSALSREAIGFVKRIDSKLQEQAFVQQLALSKLQEVATSIWSDSTIGIYGSSFTRLALPHSDIDCVLTSPSASDKQPAVLLKKLEIVLRRLSWARRVELLGNAKIPVLKIVFCQSSMSTSEVMLDLTCSHSPGHSGLNARELIYSFQVEMPALRPLVLILKSHIQRRGLNSAYTGGLSSYGLVLLAVRFLQACGDEHHLVETEANRGHNMSSSGLAQLRSGDVPPVYEFTRNGKPAWRTGLGNLLLLFLETYVTFDYRRFGITVEGNGQYFPLPADKVSLEPGAVVSPYIVDPIESTRSIGSCFRMHDIIHAWYELYQQLTNGISIENAISTRSHASSPV